MVLLDCTLRDDGYYNNCDFNRELVEKYLVSCSESRVDYAELGLRKPCSREQAIILRRHPAIAGFVW